MIRVASMSVTALLLAALFATGCSGDKSASGNKTTDKLGEGHESGPHGGPLFATPKDDFHLELMIEKDKPALLYAAGKDPKKLMTFTKEQTFTMTVKGKQDVKIEFQPDRQEKDPPGSYSRFKATGPLPDKIDLKEVEFSGEMNGKPYHFKLDED